MSLALPQILPAFSQMALAQTIFQPVLTVEICMSHATQAMQLVCVAGPATSVVTMAYVGIVLLTALFGEDYVPI